MKKNDVVAAYEKIGRSIAAYERSSEVNPFTSKYDLSLKGKVTLTDQENQELTLFNGKAKCTACHVPPLFTDFTYDNLGIPRNSKNPFYSAPRSVSRDGANWVDPGREASWPARVTSRRPS